MLHLITQNIAIYILTISKVAQAFREEIYTSLHFNGFFIHLKLVFRDSSRVNCSMMRFFIRAERSGDWSLHLNATAGMMPLTINQKTFQILRLVY